MALRKVGFQVDEFFAEKPRKTSFRFLSGSRRRGEAGDGQTCDIEYWTVGSKISDVLQRLLPRKKYDVAVERF